MEDVETGPSSMGYPGILDMASVLTVPKMIYMSGERAHGDESFKSPTSRVYKMKLLWTWVVNTQ